MKGKKSLPVSTGIILGTLSFVFIVVLMISVFSWLILDGSIGEDMMGYVCAGTLFVSPIIATLLMLRTVEQKPLLMSFVMGAIYIVLLLSCNALFFDGIYNGVGVTALCIFSGSISAALLAVRKSGSRKIRRSKVHR